MRHPRLRGAGGVGQELHVQVRHLVCRGHLLHPHRRLHAVRWLRWRQGKPDAPDQGWQVGQSTSGMEGGLRSRSGFHFAAPHRQSRASAFGGGGPPARFRERHQHAQVQLCRVGQGGHRCAAKLFEGLAFPPMLLVADGLVSHRRGTGKGARRLHRDGLGQAGRDHAVGVEGGHGRLFRLYRRADQTHIRRVGHRHQRRDNLL
mmetsp:Transcript_6302/g.15687  ORF Transcript_6302/g.15687 Transcript_6302/m.15687 type:complete len:203 (-) Transcript_6302:487-1095(-)